MSDITIHVDYNPDHCMMTFGDTNGQPILSYHTPTDRQMKNLEHLRAGRRFQGELPDGWVLLYEETWCDDHTEDERVSQVDGGSNPGDYITGIADLTAVADAVATAQDWLTGLGYREPCDR